MALDRAKILQKVAEATTTGGGNNLRDGRGRLVIKSLSLEDGFNGARFVAEFIVQSSKKIDVVNAKTGEAMDVEPNAPGTGVSWVQLLEKHDNAFGNVKSFILELFGEKDAEAKEVMDALDDVTSRNSAMGLAIDFETFRKVTKKNQVEIVIPQWAHVELSEAEVKANVAWLESLKGVEAKAA